MKCVIAFSCLLAVASAGYLNGVAPLAYANHGSHAVAYNAPLVSAPHPVHYGYAAPLAYAHAYAAPVAVAATTSSQYHAQDELGQYTYGYNNINSAKHESRAVDGSTAGGYSYVDSHGLVQSTSYVSDPINGFRVAATNLPVGAPHTVAAVAIPGSEPRLIDPIAVANGAPLPTGDSVEVAAAKAIHFQAHHEAKAGHVLVKRSPGYLNAGYAGYAAPLAYAAAPAYGYAHGVSAYSSPLAYSGYSGYGYGGHLGAYYG